MSERTFGPPRLEKGSPKPPKGVPLPRREQRVFVDTTAVLRENYRLPLAVLAREEIDKALSLHERIWNSPDASEIDRWSEKPPVTSLQDEKDRPVLAAALASKADILVSCDKGFGHGQQYANLMCWHPDTYLTSLFQWDTDVYQVVCEEVPLMERLSLLDVLVAEPSRWRQLLAAAGGLLSIRRSRRP